MVKVCLVLLILIDGFFPKQKSNINNKKKNRRKIVLQVYFLMIKIDDSGEEKVMILSLEFSIDFGFFGMANEMCWSAKTESFSCEFSSKCFDVLPLIDSADRK